MENAAEALKIAGSMLMFIIALTVGIASFGQVRQAADSALYDLDEEMMYIDGNQYYEQTGTTRQVGVETVIQAASRVFNETYKINFVFEDSHEEPIYWRIPNSGGTKIPVYTLDKEANVLQGGLIGKEIFFRAIFYGDTTTVYEDSGAADPERNFDKLYGHNVELTTPLYERLKGKTIIEYAGVYTDDNPLVPEANREKVRVITYKIS